MSDVIACVDDDDVAEAVCEAAAWASLRLEAPLSLLHVLDKAEYPASSDLSGNLAPGARRSLLQELADLDQQRGRLAMERSALLLDALSEHVRTKGVADPVSLQRRGNLIETLTDMASDIRLLVLGKSEAFAHEHVGSRLESVVRIMSQPILITLKKFTPPKAVMIAFDGSDTTCKGVETIADGQLFKGLHCHVVMVADDTKAVRAQLDWAQTLLQNAGFKAPTALLQGDVEQNLCDYRAKHDLDLLIMGAYGRSMIRRFLVGSTTTCVIRNASVPVLLLR